MELGRFDVRGVHKFLPWIRTVEIAGHVCVFLFLSNIYDLDLTVKVE